MKIGVSSKFISKRLLQSFSALALLALSGCSDLGFQGGVIPTNFTGLKTLTAISPESFQLTWDPYPGSTRYKLYVADQNDPVATPSFTTYITKPVGNPSADGTYRFSITAIDPATGLDQGIRSNYGSVKLLPHFNFQNDPQATVSALPAVPITRHAIRVTWTAYPLVNYQVFITERQATGEVDYQSFVTPSASLTGVGTVDIEGLLSGREYCAVVVANYVDGTADAPNGVKLMGTLNSLLVGQSGGFGGSVIAQSQKCARTVANQAFGSVIQNTTIYAPKAILSNNPIFYANVGLRSGGLDNTEDGQGDAKVSIYKVDPVTNLGTLVGSNTGTGKITATSSLPAGRHKFFAMLQDTSAGSTAQAKIEINVGRNSSSPPLETARPWVYVRGMGGPTADSGNYPEPQQGGIGSQKMGSAVAMGDFNCDGTSDIAIGMPDSSETLPDNRTARVGRVMIYYDVTSTDSAIKPGTLPNGSFQYARSQEVKFDVTDLPGYSRDLQLGKRLFVGNFNQDSQATNNPPVLPDSTLQPHFSCDDLAIASGAGPMFVLYGKRDSSSNSSDGGLNYYGSKSFLINPSAPCAPSTGICQPSMYSYANPALALGTAFTAGDYDGDGYPDLAVSSSFSTGIWVLRGSEYGLIPPNTYTDNSGGTESFVTSPGPNYYSFNYIPRDPTAFPTPGNTAAPLVTPSPTSDTVGFNGTSPARTANPYLPSKDDGWASGQFGASLATLHNAFYDSNTQRIRDVLLIGNPTSNVVFACLPTTLTGTRWGNVGFSDDSANNLGWACNHEIKGPTSYDIPVVSITPSGFGFSMTDFVNPLRYRQDHFYYTQGSVSGCTLHGNSSAAAPDFGNCDGADTKLGYPGAFAVGAPYSNEAFIYYGVNLPASSSSNRTALGTARNTYLYNNLLKASAQTTSVMNTSAPCPAVAGGSGNDACSIQRVAQPASGAGGYFGYTMQALRGNNIADDTTSPKESSLAVAAPFKDSKIGSSTYYEVGSVLSFRQNSRFKTDPIVNGTGGTNGAADRFSDGFSSSLRDSIDYDGPMNSNVHFGLGGMASGPLMAGSDTDYNQSSDVIVGTPNFVRTTDANGNAIPYVYDNGAALLYFSHLGTLRNFQVGASSTNNSGWHVIDGAMSTRNPGTLVGQESNIQFHEAVSIGDINQDGIGDVAVRIAQGTSRNKVRIFLGLPCTDGTGITCQVGVNRSPQTYTDFSVIGDTTAGGRFIPMGPIAGGSYGAFFVTGNSSSYIYFAGNNGLIQGVASNFGSPRKLSYPTGSAKKLDGTTLSNAKYLNFGDTNFGSNSTTSNYYNAENTSIDTSLVAGASFAVGDFNGDGYVDFAFAQTSAVNESAGVVDLSTTSACPTLPGTTYKSCLSTAQTAGAKAGSGRVYIFYGGASNGFQMQADGNGGYPLQSDYLGQDGNTYGFTTLSSTVTNSSTLTDKNTLGNPCTVSAAGVVTCNKAQVIAETATTSFGKTLTSIPMGTCNGNPVSALAVRAEQATDSLVYIYKPKCLSGTSVSDITSKMTGLDSATISSISATGLGVSSTTLGIGMTSATRLMGNEAPNTNSLILLSHLIVANQTSKTVYAFPVMQSISGTSSTYSIISDSANTNFGNFGGRILNYSNSLFIGGASGSTIGFGEGLSTLGDVNGDGYEDIAINISRLSRIELSTTFSSQGGMLLLFGGKYGLQTQVNATTLIEPSKNADCYIKKDMIQNTLVSICNPALLFAPQPSSSVRQGVHERSYLPPFSRISTGNLDATGKCVSLNSPNECLGTFLFGVPGRDSVVTPPTKPVLNGGVFYEIP